MVSSGEGKRASSIAFDETMIDSVPISRFRKGLEAGLPFTPGTSTPVRRCCVLLALRSDICEAVHVLGVTGLRDNFPVRARSGGEIPPERRHFGDMLFNQPKTGKVAVGASEMEKGFTQSPAVEVQYAPVKLEKGA
jgi:hypothetical protein